MVMLIETSVSSLLVIFSVSGLPFAILQALKSINVDVKIWKSASGTILKGNQGSCPRITDCIARFFGLVKAVSCVLLAFALVSIF